MCGYTQLACAFKAVPIIPKEDNEHQKKAHWRGHDLVHNLFLEKARIPLKSDPSV